MTHERRADFTEQRSTGLHHGQQAGRNIQRRQQLGVPLVGVHIEQQGARGIADIGGMDPALGQLPDQPSVHGAKGQFAVFGLGAGAGNMVQQPANLGAGKIRID